MKLTPAVLRGRARTPARRARRRRRSTAPCRGSASRWATRCFGYVGDDDVEVAGGETAAWTTWTYRTGPAAEPGSGDLPDSRDRLPGRSRQVRQLQSRDSGRDAARRRPDRPARHQGPGDREDGILRPVPLHHRLQGGSAILPRLEARRRSPDGAHGGRVRLVPAHGVRVRRSFSATTWGRPPGCWRAPSRSPR